ncbi:MAG: LmbU family transcriptional regulator [Solirubrobacteraceae bacterium]
MSGTGIRKRRGVATSPGDSDERGKSASLLRGSARVTNVSWSPPAEMQFEDWVMDGRRLGTIGRGVGWWIGDWLRFGNAAYGEKYVRAAKITGYDVQTLMNMSYVASRVDVSRRREKLSWSHHAEVAAMSPEDQETWLARAEECRLSVQDLRVMLREARNRERDENPEAAAATAPEPRPTAIVCPHCGHPIRVRSESPTADEPLLNAV